MLLFSPCLAVGILAVLFTNILEYICFFRIYFYWRRSYLHTMFFSWNFFFISKRVQDTCGLWANVQKQASCFTAELTLLLIFTVGHSSSCTYEVNMRLTCNRCDAGGQVLLKGVLVCLRLLRLRQDMVTGVRKVCDLNLLCLWGLQLLQAFRISTFLWLYSRPNSLSSP